MRMGTGVEPFRASPFGFTESSFGLAIRCFIVRAGFFGEYFEPAQRSLALPFRRIEADFDNGREIVLRPAKQHGIARNMLVLKFGLHVEAAVKGQLILDAVVLPLAASGNKVRADRAVFVIELKSVV